MSSALEGTTGRVPDVWYDFFVRLVPGTAYVWITLYQYDLLSLLREWEGIFSAVVAGYIAGYIASMISSPICRMLESRVGLKAELKKLSGKLAPHDRETLILSKMHAETVSMITFAVFAVTIGLVQYFEVTVLAKGNIELTPTRSVSLFSLLAVCGFFVLLAYFKISAGKERCSDLLQVGNELQEKPS